MADIIIILVLAALAGLALRACMHSKKGSDCSGNCSGCGCNCHRKNSKP